MQSIKCILIDDEQSNRAVLSKYLSKYCPDIRKIGEAANADEAFNLINELKPDLIFLDIKMPSKNGFDLLRMYREITFEVIFITAYEEYAIQAFEFNALDYVLKPIDYQRLIMAVERIKLRLASKKPKWENILHIVHSIDEKTELVKKIALHQQGIVRLIEVESISYISAMRGYCEVSTYDGQKFVSPKPLIEYEDLLSKIPYFVTISKSIIINIAYIKSYTKSSTCNVILKDGSSFQVSRRKKTEILERLKNN